MADSCSAMWKRVPIIVVLGATGTGKSKLALEIASRYGGEILSADSMQVYQGLDIITNKVTEEEQKAVKHHLIDYIDPLKRFTVVDYRNRALQVIEGLLASRTLPLVVGGTNYYIESLLWKVLVDPRRDASQLVFDRDETGVDFEDVASDGEVNAPRKRRKTDDSLDSETSAELHKKLMEVDAEMAERLHPNDRRKIVRSLQVYREHGRTHSAILQEQRDSEGGSALGGALRYPDSCILWIQCDQETLDKRLDSRVDEMIRMGLVQELAGFHEAYNAERLRTKTSPDYTTGIFQSIGFKEFHSYLTLPLEERDTEAGKRLLQDGINELKLVTRRYARKQVKWVVNRFLRRPDRQVPPVFALDGSDVSSWDELVTAPACKIVESYLHDRDLTDVTPLPVVSPLNHEWGSHTCDTCSRVFVGNLQWQIHLGSKKHKKMVGRMAKLNPAPKVDPVPKVESSSPAEEEVVSCAVTEKRD